MCFKFEFYTSAFVLTIWMSYLKTFYLFYIWWIFHSADFLRRGRQQVEAKKTWKHINQLLPVGTFFLNLFENVKMITRLSLRLLRLSLKKKKFKEIIIVNDLYDMSNPRWKKTNNWQKVTLIPNLVKQYSKGFLCKRRHS